MKRLRIKNLKDTFICDWAMNNINRNFYLMLCVTIVLAGGIIAFPMSFIMRSNVLMGLALFPFVVVCGERQRINYTFLALTIFFIVLAGLYHVRMFYFFTLAFFILFLIELFVGRVNQLVFFLLVFMSPFFHQVVIILGFPIRLLLSNAAGKILALSGMNVQVDGNEMLLNGSGFTVDEACIGLTMLATSMLIAVFMLSHHYRSIKLRLSFLSLLIFFSGILVLNVFANLLRIIMLVAFQIGPEKVMHEVMGLLCFAIYIVLPAWFFSRFMLQRFGRVILSDKAKINVGYSGYAIILTMSMTILLAGIQLYQSRNAGHTQYASVNLPGFQLVKMKDGITKAYNNNVLVYVKPITEFFSAEHTPLICWQGSGYDFKRIRKVTVEGREIYFAELNKNHERLFTAWWYTNGETQTINQLDWRFRMMKGERDFSVVNVTAKDESTLFDNVGLLLLKNDLLALNECL